MILLAGCPLGSSSQTGGSAASSDFSAPEIDPGMLVSGLTLTAVIAAVLLG